jgi:hypothetical protein
MEIPEGSRGQGLNVLVNVFSAIPVCRWFVWASIGGIHTGLPKTIFHLQIFSLTAVE